MTLHKSYVSLDSLMPKHVGQSFAYACLSGIMLGCAFPPMPFGFLAFFAFIPLFVILEAESSRHKKTIVRYLYCTFFLYQGIANWWVGSWQKESDPFLIIAGLALQIGHPFFLMLPFIAFFYIRQRMASVFAYGFLPCLYVAYEWLHSLTDASYPWLSIGYMTMSIEPIQQCADLFGIWGLTFLLMVVNILLFQFLIKKDKRIVLGCLIALIAILSCTVIYGLNRSLEVRGIVSTSPSIKIGIVQPNINPWNKWEGEVRDQIFIHKSTMAKSVKNIPDLWLWSETAIPFVNVPLNVYKDFSSLQSIIGKTPILTGFANLELVEDPSKEPLSKPFRLIPGSYYVAYNAAALLQDSTVSIHRKMRLTPFGEGFPFSQDIPWLGSILQWGVGISGWKKGEIQQPLKLYKDHQLIASIGTVICIESIYPEFVRNYAVSGATMLAVITNDAWFDNTPGPMQHFVISQMRAIENRRAIARCGNTGISGIIYPDGSIAKMANPQIRTVIIGDIPIISMDSLYMHVGDLLPKICSIASCIILCLAGYKGFMQRKSQ